MPSPFDTVRSFVAEEIARRDALPAGPLSPSDYWKDYNRFSSYIRTLPDDELKLIRYHTWHLTGDNYQNYHFINRKFERELVAGYEALLPRLGGFRPQEPPNSFGVDTPHGRISTSIFRYTVVLDDLHKAGLLPRQGGRRILEIGGGYGGLALLCLQFNPEVSYLICDLEESLFVQGVFLTQHLGPDRVKLVRGEHGDLDDLRPGCVHLLPQSRADALEKVRFDLAINQQSMQEMNLPQVERYCQLLEKCADRFYSCNRNSHNKRVVRAKGLVANLHGYLAGRFTIVWDSAKHVPWFVGACLRHRHFRKIVYALIGKSFMPQADAALPRFVYRCGPASAACG